MHTSHKAGILSWWDPYETHVLSKNFNSPCRPPIIVSWLPSLAISIAWQGYAHAELSNDQIDHCWIQDLNFEPSTIENCPQIRASVEPVSSCWQIAWWATPTYRELKTLLIKIFLTSSQLYPPWPGKGVVMGLPMQWHQSLLRYVDAVQKYIDTWVLELAELLIDKPRGMRGLWKSLIMILIRQTSSFQVSKLWLRFFAPP